MSTQSSVTICQLGPDDVPRMRELLDLFGRAFEQLDVYGDAQPDDGYLQRLLGRDHFIALAALRKGRIIGGLAAYELEKFEQARSELYIYDLAVTAEHRREGLATALIQRLRDIAADRGAYTIFVQADLGYEPAIALYSKLGIPEDVLHFDIEV